MSLSNVHLTNNAPYNGSTRTTHQRFPFTGIDGRTHSNIESDREFITNYQSHWILDEHRRRV